VGFEREEPARGPEGDFDMGRKDSIRRERGQRACCAPVACRYNARAMHVQGMIEALNALSVGEISKLRQRVQEVRDAAARAELTEIAALLDQALDQLAACDLKAFRRKVAHAVSRLGHAREAVDTRG
jgi:hypothetical protein